MIAKKIKHTDYNGVEREEIFHFHLNKAELMEMELSIKGGLSSMIEDIVSATETNKIIETFKKIILASYGVKSDDGRRFIKTKEIQDEFTQTEAYSNLFMELATNTDSAIEFVNGIMPLDSGQRITKEDVERVQLLSNVKDDQEV